MIHALPLIPTEGAPAATAAKAYSICTNFPDGLKINKYTHEYNQHAYL